MIETLSDDEGKQGDLGQHTLQQWDGTYREFGTVYVVTKVWDTQNIWDSVRRNSRMGHTEYLGQCTL